MGLKAARPQILPGQLTGTLGLTQAAGDTHGGNHHRAAGQDAALDLQPLDPLIVFDDLGNAVTEGKFDILLPQGRRLNDVTVGVDDCGLSVHTRLLRLSRPS